MSRKTTQVWENFANCDADDFISLKFKAANIFEGHPVKNKQTNKQGEPKKRRAWKKSKLITRRMKWWTHPHARKIKKKKKKTGNKMRKGKLWDSSSNAAVRQQHHEQCQITMDSPDRRLSVISAKKKHSSHMMLHSPAWRKARNASNYNEVDHQHLGVFLLRRKGSPFHEKSSTANKGCFFPKKTKTQTHTRRLRWWIERRLRLNL